MKGVTTDVLQVLSLIAVLAALLLVVLLAVGMVRTLFKALFGSATFVLPFTGCELAPKISSILTQRLGHVERELSELSKEIVEQTEEFADGKAVKTACGGVQSARHLTREETEWVDGQPIDGQLIEPITAFGVTVSPETVFSLLYRLRNIVAPRVVHGTVHQLGTTIRLSVCISERLGWRRRDRHVPGLAPVPGSEGLFALVDDAAFAIVRQRIAQHAPPDPHPDRCRDSDLDPHLDTWAGYRSFQRAYLHHLKFLRSGEPDEREAATRSYEQAIAAEADHHLAHYNLGLLLYARYTAVDNEKAIRHFGAATACSSTRIRMLALTGTAMANAQQVHRYGCTGEPWVGRADDASKRAWRIGEERKEQLEEVYFARGWAAQVRGNPNEAVGWYGRATVPPLRGDAVQRAEQRRLKSFAQTNAGYLALTALDAADEAEVLFRDALRHNPFNQMSHANLADMFCRRGEYDEAIAEYGEALKLEPSYFNAMNEMALVYVQKARHECDPAARDALLAMARERHAHAVALVPGDDENDRIRLRRAFDDALDDGGLRSWLRRSVPFSVVRYGGAHRNGHG